MAENEIDPEEIFDIAIIGSGPVGLYAAYYAGLRGMKTKIIDSLPEVGGQLAALYPEKYIFDVAGYAKVYARDLVANLNEQAAQYEPTLALDQKVTKLIPGDVITLETDKGPTHYAKSVIIAAGVGAFLPRKMDIPGIAELEGRGLHYFVSDKSSLAGKKLVIVGGGDSAFDWSINLHGDAVSVTQIHRSDKFKAHEDTIEKVKSLPIDLRTFHELKEVHGEEHVEAVTIFDNRTKEEFKLECEALLLNLGFLTNLGPIKEWGLEIEKNSIFVNSRMETNIAGVYAAGDICTYDGKLKLIATGFGEAAIAVNHAKGFVDPTAKVNPGHSSDHAPEKPKH
ncbi:MAG: NAD(P)/FAD-dependent oxidoreductase [Capsulimonas sp.]|uniref:NAD(P)/FAD-dependent oxidoreductase n=1 Tax=Capsulimonas sp. TaxID=2494211 RepID=UPI0032675D57